MNLLEIYPFISLIYDKRFEFQYPVVIDLISKHYISFYNLNKMNTNDRHDLLEITKNWYKKNTKIPLSLYYKEQVSKYSQYLEYIENKDYEVIKGFQGINLKNLSEKRIKRKIIRLD